MSGSGRIRKTMARKQGLGPISADFETKPCFLRSTLIILVLFLVVFYPVISAAEDAHQPTSQPKAEPKKEALTIEGLYLGRIGKIDAKGRFLYLLPEVEGLRKKTIFLDAQTKFIKNRKPFSKKKLEVGQKVAVRFFGEGSLLLALGVFVVEDEFKVNDYRIRR